MKAAIGDRIVVVSPHIGGVVRDCRVIELRNADGSPPYVVRWSDTGQEALYFPGSDGRLERVRSDAASEPEQPAIPHVATWKVEIQLFEQGAGTTARAILHAGADIALEGRGQARRAPGDVDVPEIGDEVAVARALRHLADSLLDAASVDLSGIEHHKVTLAE